MREQCIDIIEAAPSRFRDALRGLNDERLDTPYRPGGWTVRQVVHHVADSHMNSFIRCRLALTEEEPTIKPYDEKAWAELADTYQPVEPSLRLLEGLHQRWAALYRSISDRDFGRKFRHPEMGKSVRLDTCLAGYAWHCRHHTAHITALRERMGWK
jgi:DinB superfamily